MVAVETSGTSDSIGFEKHQSCSNDGRSAGSGSSHLQHYSRSSSNIYTSVSIVVSKALVALVVVVAVGICSIKGGNDISKAPMAMLAAIAVGVVAYDTNGSIRNTKT
ncbi:hypothetical protein ElyMa_000269200 [Elysia marginata]|uniref:Uncharacterized protein n=1 Tax=Elysia marginata TaxID=1093978 RepID=A0AAV4F4F8_9GAST|nr:hypothetical protein ElyMa_000269200 [Elysia marginata]